MPEEEHHNGSHDLFRIIREGITVEAWRAPSADAGRRSRQLNQAFLVVVDPLMYAWISEGEPAEW